MKAIYKGKCCDPNGYAVHLFYEYRGHEYMVTDEHNGYSESMAEKHAIEQERIDRIINMENESKTYSGTVEKEINELFELWEG